jgi:hypothetical protein
MLKPILVAAAATFITGHLEVAVLRCLNLVSRMAIGANRTAFIAPGQKQPMNALVIGLLDGDMALTASLGDICGIDGGIPIHGALDSMDPVTIITGGGND